jgi:hypothetical protein
MGAIPRRYVGLIALLVLFGFLGCGPRSQRQPLSGKVTFKGQPLGHGSIQFLTTEGPPGPAAGALIQNGAYQIPQQQGLDPGTYRVLISSAVEAKTLPPGWAPGASRPTEERIPPVYSSHAKGNVTIEVTLNGSTVFDFDID